MAQSLQYLSAIGGLAAFQLPGAWGEVGAEPVEGLPPKALAFLAIERGRVFALACAGHRGGAGGAVAGFSLEVVG